MKRRTAAREAQRGLDEHERGDDLEVEHEGNTQDLPQEAIVILEHRGQLHMPTLGPLFANEVHPKNRCVAHSKYRAYARVEQFAQHAAPRALAPGGAVALQPAAVSNERVAQEDSFHERGIAQHRKDIAVCVKFKNARGARIHRNCKRDIREGTLGESLGVGHVASEMKVTAAVLCPVPEENERNRETKEGRDFTMELPPGR